MATVVGRRYGDLEVKIWLELRWLCGVDLTSAKSGHRFAGYGEAHPFLSNSG